MFSSAYEIITECGDWTWRILPYEILLEENIFGKQIKMPLVIDDINYRLAAKIDFTS